MAEQFLHFGKDLDVPIDVLTARGWIAGLPKSGKTSTAVVEVEEAWKHGVTSSVITPTDVWHGIRSSADGEHEGLGHVIFGGSHADLPLRPDMGAALARAVADGLSVVITLSGMKIDDRATLVADYCEALLEMNTTPMLQVFDEAHLLAPQGQASSDERKRCRDAIIAIVATGRAPAQIGVRCITQRLSRLHKDITELAELVVVHKLKGPNDRAAARPWLEDYFEEPKPMLARLPKLKRGEAFYVAPEFEVAGIFQVRMKGTYDTSDSERISDGKKREPKGRASVDLSALGETFAKAAERVREEDPKHLREQIAELKRQLAEAPKAEPQVERIEVPVIGAEQLQMLADLASDIGRRAPELEQTARRIQTSVQDAMTLPEATNGNAPASTRGRVRHEAFSPPPAPPPPLRTETIGSPPAKAKAKAPRSADGKLGGAAKEIINVLAQFQDGLTREQIALLTGRKPRGGSWNTAMKTILDGAYAEEVGDKLRLLAAGVAEALDVEPLSGSAIITRWRQSLPLPAQEMLDVLLFDRNRIWTLEELSERTHRTPRGGSWNTAVKSLRESSIAISHGRDALQLNPDLALVAA